MRTKSDSPSRRRVAMLGVVGGSLLLSACGQPVSPTLVAVEVAPVVAASDRAHLSGANNPNLAWCRYCPEIDPMRVPPYKPTPFSLSMLNSGEGAVDTVQVGVYLVGVEGRQVLIGESRHTAPRPGGTTEIALEFAVPAGMAPGTYALQAVIDPDNRIAESDDSDNVWTSRESITILASR